MKNNNENRELSIIEIESKIREKETELLQLKVRKQTGQVEKPHLLKALRREIAQLKTFLTQKKSAV